MCSVVLELRNVDDSSSEVDGEVSRMNCLQFRDHDEYSDEGHIPLQSTSKSAPTTPAHDTSTRAPAAEKLPPQPKTLPDDNDQDYKKQRSGPTPTINLYPTRYPIYGRGHYGPNHGPCSPPATVPGR
ncbi:unnamed protein product, partial [Iphiclides podalirius]